MKTTPAPAPEAAAGLKVFQVTAAGFDASSAETDDLVFLIAANSAQEVQDAIRDTGAVFCDEVLSWSVMDIDFTLPMQEIGLSQALLEKASDHRNANRAVA